MTTRQANAELAKEQEARAAEAKAVRTALAAAQQTLQDEKAAHRNAAAAWIESRPKRPSNVDA